jgi:glycosyltransferase involved in cell wall biosynthesis
VDGGAGPARRSRSDAGGSRRRVLWLTKGLGRGGTERLLVGAARLIDRSAWDVEVAYVLPWKDAFVAALEAEGVRVHCLGTGRTGSLAWVGALRRLVRDGRFDIVHTHMPYPALVARLALGRGGPVIVHTEHNMWSRYRRPTCWSNALTYHRNAHVIAVSEGVAESVRPPGFLRPQPVVEVVHHGVEPSSIRRGPAARADGRARLGLAPDDLVVGTVGNLTAKKDHATLLRAVAELRPTHPNLHAVVIGSGPLEAQTRALADELGLAGAVVFTGSRDDVFDLLPALDVFVLSSRFEGLSIALLEAMASGVPIAATSVGGIPEAVTDGQEGLLVEPGRPDLLALVLARLLDDAAARERMGEAAVSRASGFELGAAVRRTESIYDDVLAGAGR